MKISISEKGFTLIEMAFVILIMGMIIGAVFSFMSSQRSQTMYQDTVKRQQKVAGALAYFAQSTGRLPCPAAQNDDIDIMGTSRTNCTTNFQLQGFVPFRTLGLTREDASDGYGNPFTYAVSEVATSAVTTSEIHSNCRDAIWIPSTVNLNPNKASFCCRRDNIGSRMRVFSNQGGSTLISPNQTEPGAGSGFNAPNPTSFSGVNSQVLRIPMDRLAYFAYVLVSHGADARLSYTFPQIGATFLDRKEQGNAGAAEILNGDCLTSANCSNMEFVSIPLSTASGTSHFDDIVLWRTQERVISEFNNDSCARP